MQAIISGEINRCGVAELLKQRRRSGEEIVKTIVEGESNASRRKLIAAEVTDRLTQR